MRRTLIILAMLAAAASANAGRRDGPLPDTGFVQSVADYIVGILYGRRDGPTGGI